MDSPGGLQAEKKVSFSYSFGFLLQTKEFQQNRNLNVFQTSTFVTISFLRMRISVDLRYSCWGNWGWKCDH